MANIISRKGHFYISERDIEEAEARMILAFKEDLNYLSRWYQKGCHINNIVESYINRDDDHDEN